MMQELFETLQQRRRPEDVAEIIHSQLGDSFSSPELRILDRAAKHSIKRGYMKFTSMLETFCQPISPEKQVHKALELFHRTETWTASECADPDRVQRLINELSPIIGKKPGASDFKRDRLNGVHRSVIGLDISRRRYNKLFRFLTRLETKLRRYVRELTKYDFTRIGKSRLATKISFEDFSRDPATAAFVAYFTARCNLRSEFTNTAQHRPYDEIAEMLFRRLQQNPEKTCWRAVAFVFPDREVLFHLTDTEKGELLGRWLVYLREIAELLQEVWSESNIERTTMIVKRGNDSTTWNNTASAWNKARDSWIALLQSMGMQQELDSLCLGKVLRLMAADVAYWHKASGGGLEPDTLVWSELPLPWQVLHGDSNCTRELVMKVCAKHGVDPTKKGWIAQPGERRVEKYSPTPELVHGVTVVDPGLAKILRRAGWFSGQGTRDLDVLTDLTVVRDEHGFALEVQLDKATSTE